MRKKSHISLAKYIVNDMQVPELMEHRKAFYLGSILPDCRPSFLTKKHEFELTYDSVREQILGLTEKCDVVRRNARVYARRLGEVIHYLADYFTFPHNKTYEGTLKEHCSYEKELKFKLREYVRSGEAFRERIETNDFMTAESVFSFIQASHREYLSRKRNVEDDCIYIVRVCHQVVQAILKLLSIQIEKRIGIQGIQMTRRLCIA